MKNKILNLALILTSLIGYLEWGGNNSMFLFQGEYDILTKLFIDPLSVVHPFTILPLLGQIILLITLFQKIPGKLLTYIGMIGIGVLMLMIFIVGIISFNYWILLSSLPYLITSAWVIVYYRKR
ncbi:MAG: hypothetical protein ABFS32_05450 [Bacteroidota bacterium]